MIPAFLLRLGWARILKVALPALAAVIVVSLGWWAWSVYDRTKAERDVAVADVLEMRRVITDATVPVGKDGGRALLSVPDAKAALAAVVRDRDNARVNLTRIDRDTKAAKARADQADAALVQAQRANLARQAAVQSRIDELERARPAATAAENEAAINADSKAAWESWR